MSFIKHILDIIFPPQCAVCCVNPAEKFGICADCMKEFVTEGFEKCPACGENALKCSCPNEYTDHTKTTIGGYSYCVLTFYKSVNKFGNSDRITERMIYSLKERGEFADFFASELSRELKRLFDRAEIDISEWIITYPPRSRAKFRELGFDQCEIMSEKLAELLGIPCVSLFYRDDGDEQKTLAAHERVLNADSSLKIDRSKVEKNRKYIVVDDIITTGSTMSTAARNLYFCGASEVFPTAVAKTMRKN